MKTQRRDYQLEGVTYPATITYKRMKSMTMRLDTEKGTLRVSCPTYTRLSDIDAFVCKHLPRLCKKVSKKKEPYDGRNLYVFGESKEVGELEPAEVIAYYRKVGLPYVQGRVDYYKALMGISAPYKVRMRDMRRTYGSNSRATQSLTFQCRLVAFHPSIIDSVVVHELAHHYQFDHSKKFYDIVYRYCPDYDKLRKKLIHDQFEG